MNRNETMKTDVLDNVHLVLTDYLHKRQLRQENGVTAGLPPSESAVPPTETCSEKDLDNKVAGLIEPVRSSAVIM